MTYILRKGVSSVNDLIDGGAALGNPFATHYYVDNISGSTGGDGTIGDPSSTIARAVSLVSAGDVIHVKGTSTDYSESVVCTVDNITFIGYGFGVETGGWTPAAQNGTCLTLSGARGSRVTGFLFRGNGTTGVAIDISETVANDSDSITIDNNVFKATSQDVGHHIFANGCPGYIKIYNNHFTWGVIAIGATNAPNTSATGWEIVGNYFSDKLSTGGIYMPLRRSLIKDNHFSAMTTCIDTVGYAATNGDYNDVNGNYIFETATWANVTNAQTNDSWQGNYHNFAVNTSIGGA